MKKGISPIVAVVLLIAIAVIAAVGLYFWVGGIATQQPTPDTPGTITAVCTMQGSVGILTVSNTGTTALADADLTYGGGTCDLSCKALGVGDTCVCSHAMSSGNDGTVYGASVASAQYNC